MLYIRHNWSDEKKSLKLQQGCAILYVIQFNRGCICEGVFIINKLGKNDIIEIFESIENSKIPFDVNWFNIEKHADDIAKIINDVIANKIESDESVEK